MRLLTKPRVARGQTTTGEDHEDVSAIPGSSRSSSTTSPYLMPGLLQRSVDVEGATTQRWSSVAERDRERERETEFTELREYL